MWSDRLIPALLRAQGISRLDDIPLDATGADYGAWCAYYESDLSFRNLAGRWHPRRHTYAGLADTPEWARFFCMMEAAERASGLSAHTMSRLAFEGGSGPAWAEFSPYAPEQWVWNASYPDAEPRWRVRAQGWLSGTLVDVPADAVFPWWRSYAGRKAPLPEGEGGGFAAGFEWASDACALRGLYEVVERDAAMLSWRVDAWPARALSLGLLDPRLRAYAKDTGLTLELFDVGDPQLAPVIIALLSRDDGEVVLGASCGVDVAAVADKATREAFMLRGTAQLLDRDTPPLTVDAVLDSADHLVYAWRHGGEVLAWYRRKARRDAPPSGAGDNLAERCARTFGAEPLIIDVTHPELVAWRIRVMRILQPNAFRKEYRHAWRYAGGTRLRVLCPDPKAIHTAPHPIG
ncbi:YcaO-like family protein [Burkholderia ubonensis]|uniref:YcaO-like family protein n=1 Tax=Burkholderia ubonensis TaxID=101571 RepID=UPI0009B330C0|nr:YcaO-like family protein [Burkholderia ubonensis]